MKPQPIVGSIFVLASLAIIVFFIYIVFWPIEWEDNPNKTFLTLSKISILLMGLTVLTWGIMFINGSK